MTTLPNIPEVRDALHAWASGVLGVASPVIWAFQDAPRPPLPYVTLTVMALTPIGHDYVSSPNLSGGEEDGGIAVVTGERDFTLSVQGHGPGALGLLSLLQSSLSRPTVLEALGEAGLAVMDEGAATDITELVGTRHQERALLEVRYGLRSQVADEVGTIDTVILLGEVGDQENEQTIGEEG